MKTIINFFKFLRIYPDMSATNKILKQSDVEAITSDWQTVGDDLMQAISKSFKEDNPENGRAHSKDFLQTIVQKLDHLHST